MTERQKLIQEARNNYKAAAGVFWKSTPEEAEEAETAWEEAEETWSKFCEIHDLTHLDQ